ncbi:MAG: MBL fold metallo-hydrolase [Acidobacteria bacterium]|nr:MBL fold metallo-hydrolase [Acidobacteriota bacterium]
MAFDEVLPGLFRIEVPLPHSPLRSINSWVIPGGSRTLVIDTGMNMPECERALRSGLDELGVDLERTDFFITHVHADHIGLVSALHRPGTRALIGAREAAILERWTSPERFFEYMEDESAKLGFPAEEIERAKREHPGVRFSPRSYPPFIHVDEGDEIEAGSYRFRAVETPGHTPGHMCLWDEERKLLISGDHILGDITPNITSWPGLDDALGAYLTRQGRAARRKAGVAGAPLCDPGRCGQNPSARGPPPGANRRGDRAARRSPAECLRDRVEDDLGHRSRRLGALPRCPEVVRDRGGVQPPGASPGAR